MFAGLERALTRRKGHWLLCLDNAISAMAMRCEGECVLAWYSLGYAEFRWCRRNAEHDCRFKWSTVSDSSCYHQHEANVRIMVLYGIRTSRGESSNMLTHILQKCPICIADIRVVQAQQPAFFSLCYCMLQCRHYSVWISPFLWDLVFFTVNCAIVVNQSIQCL